MNDMRNDPARTRFAAIQIVRLTGVVLAVIGILAVAGRLSLPVEAGYALAAVGILDALIVPTLLARRWKSPPP